MDGLRGSSRVSPTKSLTLVIGFRDRDVIRLHRCLESLQRQTFQDFVVHLVDYGSAPHCSALLMKEIAGYDFCKYIYSETRGFPWNRSLALNIGGRLARSEFVMTTDADMVFPADFLDVLMSDASKARVLNCYHHFLPPDFDDWDSMDSYRGKLPTATKAAFGPCQCIATSLFHQIRGFDEYYQYWGIEDRDMNQRLMRLGLDETWLNDKTSMYHQWHPPVDVKTQDYIPSRHWARMQNHYCRFADQIVRNDENWGRILTEADRPVFRFLNFQNEELNHSEELILFEGRVDNERDVGNFVRQFWELPSGHAIAVGGAEFPSRFGWLDKGLGAVNRTLRHAGKQSRVGYTANVLHSYMTEFLECNRDIVQDYFLGYPNGYGVTLIVRT